MKRSSIFNAMSPLRALPVLAVISLTYATNAHLGAVFPDNPTTDYKAVGIVGTSDGSGAVKLNGCGVAISENWVIGVAHVGGNVFIEDNKPYPIVQKIIHKAAGGEPADLALYRLGKPVPVYAPILLAPFEGQSSATSLKGHTVYIVGYGRTAKPKANGTGWEPVQNSEGIRRMATNTIDYTEIDRYNIGSADQPKWKSSACLVYDLDKPGDPSFSSLGTAITPDEGGVGAKDSGGGWFVKVNGKSYLVAISASVGRLAGSKATSDYGYGALGFGVHLTPYRNWIHQVTQLPALKG